MRRQVVIFLLGFAVLASAGALAFYGFSYGSAANQVERQEKEDLLAQLADEKILAIEDHIVPQDRKVFEAIHLDRLQDIPKIIPSEGAAVVSVFVLDADLRPVPSGYFPATSWSPEVANGFRDRFLTDIVPQLHLRAQPIGVRGHLHGVFDGEELLFAFEHRQEDGKDFYVVLDTDLKYLVGEVFPQVFPSSRAPQLYQVVDENGELVYGTPFTNRGIVVDRRFDETVDQWHLRAAQREVPGNPETPKTKLRAIVIVALSVGGMVAGLGFLFLAMYRERKANELKSEFITNVSHELKTPLSIISMFGEMLALGRVKSTEQTTEYAEIIWRESVRLARLIDNVLDFAKIDRGKDVYEFGEGDVADVVLRALELSQHRLQKAEMTVDLDIAEDLPPARIDANAYTLAVMNLIDNAIKYAAEGKRLVLRVRSTGGRIVLEVKDFGPGIDPSEHKQIFERFYRSRSVRLKPIRGSGIGLALVDHIARAHGGGTWVESAVGKGATFVLWIPLPT
jgi:two-component system phosphate regulon sensor histidine kinase PhoR